MWCPLSCIEITLCKSYSTKYSTSLSWPLAEIERQALKSIEAIKTFIAGNLHAYLVEKRRLTYKYSVEFVDGHLVITWFVDSNNTEIIIVMSGECCSATQVGSSSMIISLILARLLLLCASILIKVILRRSSSFSKNMPKSFTSTFSVM